MTLYNEPNRDSYGMYEHNFFPSRGAVLNRDLRHLSKGGRELFKNELVDQINAHSWSYFITLTFEHDIKSSIDVGGVFRRFIDELSAVAYGKRSKKRVRAAPVLERCDSDRIHIHCLIEDIVSRISNPEKARDFNVRHEVIKAWVKCDYRTSSPLRATSKQDKWFQEIYKGDKLISYIFKEVERGSNPALYEEFSFEGRRIK